MVDLDRDRPGFRVTQHLNQGYKLFRSLPVVFSVAAHVVDADPGQEDEARRELCPT